MCEQNDPKKGVNILAKEKVHVSSREGGRNSVWQNSLRDKELRLRLLTGLQFPEGFKEKVEGGVLKDPKV